MFSTAETVAMLAATGGVSIAYGAQETTGHFDVADSLLLEQAQVVGATMIATIPTGSLTDLAEGEPITVGEDECTIADYRRSPRDGGLTLIFLASD